MLIKLQKECERINYEEVNDKYTKFTWVIVENEIQTAETLIFTVKLSKKTAICHAAGVKLAHRVHQNQALLVVKFALCNQMEFWFYRT
jgi:hypothetical protein